MEIVNPDEVLAASTADAGPFVFFPIMKTKFAPIKLLKKNVVGNCPIEVDPYVTWDKLQNKSQRPMRNKTEETQKLILTIDYAQTYNNEPMSKIED